MGSAEDAKPKDVAGGLNGQDALANGGAADGAKSCGDGKPDPWKTASPSGSSVLLKGLTLPPGVGPTEAPPSFSTGDDAVKTAHLEAAIRATTPRALLLPSWLMRRVIQEDRRLGIVTIGVPHRKTYLIRRRRLAEMVDDVWLKPLPPGKPEDFVYLLAAPGAARLARQSWSDLLKEYWRRIFHLAVHQVWTERVEMQPLGADDWSRRIDRLGLAAFEEIRQVLDRDQFLLPPLDDRTVYEEFTAVYLELRHFAPNLLRNFFPSVAERWTEIDALLAEDVPTAELLARTRPQGAEDHDKRPVETDVWRPDPTQQELSDEWIAEASGSFAPQAARHLAKAEAARKSGNLIRAARLETYVSKKFPGDVGDKARVGAWRLIEELVRKLSVPLEIAASDRHRWTTLLFQLLDFAPPLRWTAEARLLYDLQSIAVDYAREFSQADLVEWVLWRFQRPLKRPLPDQPLLQVALHLRRAIGRLPALRVTNSVRRGLREALQGANALVEERVRKHFRPKVMQALLDGGLTPSNVPESVAHAEVADVVCDQIVNQGYFNFGCVRDAVSANQMKLRDVDGPVGAFRGDELLRLDRVFAERLDGVYRRAEFYLRWQQSFSSLAFGTPVGRFLTLNVAIPFGGAFVLLRGAAYLALEVEHLFFSSPGHAASHVDKEHHAKAWEASVAGWPNVLLVGLVILALVHSRTVRWAFQQAAWWGYRSLRGALVDIPSYLVDNPWLRAWWKTRVGLILARNVLVPGALSLLTWPLWRAVFDAPSVRWSAVAACWAALIAVFQTRRGREAFEIAWDHVVRGWFQFWAEVIPNGFRWIAGFFKMFVERTERTLYAVDESFRFKKGESALWGYLKIVFGAVWFFIHYAVRFCVVLLIEPQINPIKHFPVVTVSHKLILPMAIPLGAFLQQVGYVDTRAAGITIAGLFLSGIPGIFGYLAWELKENWKLYAANRPPELRPVVVGSHGETMRLLLQPGFHSGTIPKYFNRLRRADRKGAHNGDWRNARAIREQLHHVEHEVSLFFEREFLALVRESRSWEHLKLELGHVRLSTLSILVDVRCPNLGRDPMTLELILLDQSLVARIVASGFLPLLTPAQRTAFQTALLGVYHYAGVVLSRERLAHLWKVDPAAVELSRDGVEAKGPEGETVFLPYPWNAELAAAVRPSSSSRWKMWEVFEKDALLPGAPIAWGAWVVFWDRERGGFSGPASEIASAEGAADAPKGIAPHHPHAGK